MTVMFFSHMFGSLHKSRGLVQGLGDQINDWGGGVLVMPKMS